MESIKFIQDSHGFYSSVEATSYKICILGRLFTDEIVNWNDSFKKWAENNESEFFGGNITNLEQTADTVTLSDDYSEQPDGGPYFTISKTEFIRLIDEWLELYKKKPKEILLTYANNTFSFRANLLIEIM